ncbi:MAG: fatty acid desaturase [Gammaproteobacteria bacterium]
MKENFETRPIIDIASLRTLQERDDIKSLLRLAIHLTVFVTLAVIVGRNQNGALAALALSVALAWVWSGIFAPYHECTHETAFKTPWLNTAAVWLTGIPFALPPAVYKTFHFDHHRYTQDVDKDPEILNDKRYLQWPMGLKAWLTMALGLGLIKLKLSPILGFAFKPEQRWHEFAKWVDHAPDKRALVFESRLLLAIWLGFIIACVLWIPGGGWLLFAAWLTHVFQTLWVASEHTGLPEDGNILRRTRTVTSNAFVRFWLWNMNYHAEHHAWPSIPWHKLPAAHAQISDQLESWVPSYSDLHRNVITATNAPTCDSLRASN